jgi:predicted dehydrogenase
MTPQNTYTTERKRERLRFGLVGAGAIAQAYLQAFEDCDDARIVAVTDPRADAAQGAAERMRCASYDRVERMVEECKLDAAVVCTPPITHPDICVHLAEHGVHVLCEKPFAIDQPSARRMLDAAHKAGVKITMASKFRFVEDIVHAKSMVSSGVLGDLVLFENVFASRVDMAQRWNSRPEVSGGGVLIDNGTHSVDLMRYFLGPLSDVHALEGRRSQGLSVDETVALFVRSVSGVICNIDLSWSITKQRESYLDIYGSRGAISVGWKKSAYLDFSFGKWVNFGHGYSKVQAFRSQIQNFSKAIRGEEPLLLSSEDAMASVSIIESAYTAMRQNQWVPVATPAAGHIGNRHIVN